MEEYKDIANFTFLEGPFAVANPHLPKFEKLGFKGSTPGEKVLIQNW